VFSICTCVYGDYCENSLIHKLNGKTYVARGGPKGHIKGFIPPKLPKFDLTDAERVANLVNVSI